MNDLLIMIEALAVFPENPLEPHKFVVIKGTCTNALVEQVADYTAPQAAKIIGTWVGDQLADWFRLGQFGEVPPTLKFLNPQTGALVYERGLDVEAGSGWDYFFFQSAHDAMARKRPLNPLPYQVLSNW